MTSHSYAKKCFVVCYLGLILVINAVAEMSLAQYFGTDKPLSSESDIFVRDCDTEEMQKRCYEKCGPNHACLPGQCICFKDKASPEEVSDEELQQVKSSEEKNRGAEVLNENESPNKNIHVSETLHCLLNTQHRNKEENLNTASNEESNSVDEKLAATPALRHHIAHFCPNLDKARVCIRKCMNLGLPAFCGKDHICYCGHKGEYSMEVGKSDSVHNHQKKNPFRDLYERYFGIPEPKKTK